MAYVIGTFLVCLIGFLVTLVWFDKYEDDHKVADWKKYTTFVFCVIFGIVGFGYLIATILFVGDYATSNNQKIKAEINRDNLERLLLEDYDPDNLKNALEFNALQKRSAEYNKTAFWYCWDNCYSIDTIAIPRTKYMPSNMVKLDAVIDHLTDKIATEKTK